MKKAIILCMTAILLLSGCKGKETEPGPGTTIEKETATLTIVEDTWGAGVGGIATHTNNYEYTNPQVGDNLYGGFADLIVKSVTKKKIVLTSTGGLAEPNEDGNVDLLGKSIETVTLNVGDEITLVTQTMDAGATLHISYHY